MPYACDNGSLIQISFSADQDGRANATLHFSDDTVTLPQVPAASGVLYRANDIRLHTHNDEAVLEDAKGNSLHCKRGNVAPAKAETSSAASSFIDISGRIYFYNRVPLPADAVMIIKIQDAARAGARARTLAEVEINPIEQIIPVPFQTTIDRDLISKKAKVTVNVRIEQQGKLLFISDKVTPALVKGKPVFVEMQLKPVSQ
jgi:putative lipoprotein